MFGKSLIFSSEGSSQWSRYAGFLALTHYRLRQVRANWPAKYHYY